MYFVTFINYYFSTFTAERILHWRSRSLLYLQGYVIERGKATHIIHKIFVSDKLHTVSQLVEITYVCYS